MKGEDEGGVNSEQGLRRRREKHDWIGLAYHKGMVGVLWWKLSLRWSLLRVGGCQH